MKKRVLIGVCLVGVFAAASALAARPDYWKPNYNKSKIAPYTLDDRAPSRAQVRGGAARPGRDGFGVICTKRENNEEKNENTYVVGCGCHCCRRDRSSERRS